MLTIHQSFSIFGNDSRYPGVVLQFLYSPQFSIPLMDADYKIAVSVISLFNRGSRLKDVVDEYR